MDVMEAIRKRRSVRKYSNRRVDDETVGVLLEAARLAPSARNIQNRKYVVLDNIDDEVADACNGQSWVSTAPLMMMGLIDPTVNKWAETDMAIAFEQVVLEAVELGLGTCWIGAFDEGKIKRIIGAPENMRVYALLSIGYPETNPSQMTSKKPIDEIWSKDKYKW
ncbi:MAG TPA: nitroreductase family protein [Candidatus Methanofastidiosa archaeon]|nr:nitroreductase family protein [Candidatus Methanofastidiosa archaeon]